LENTRRLSSVLLGASCALSEYVVVWLVCIILGLIKRKNWQNRECSCTKVKFYYFRVTFESIMIITAGSISSRLVRPLLWTMLTSRRDNEIAERLSRRRWSL